MAQRSAWKGALSWGLINIPVKAYKATEERGVSFHMLHATDFGRIKQNRTCSVCSEELVGMGEIVRGYEVDEGTTVPFTAEDFESLPGGTNGIVNLCQISGIPDPLKIGDSYFLAPEKTGVQALSILTAAMKKLKAKSVLGSITVRDRERPCYLWIRDGQIVLSTLRWDDEIRSVEIEYDEPTKDQVTMGLELLEAMNQPVPEVDGYREAVIALATAKAKGSWQPTPLAKAKSQIKADGLTDMLKQAVQEARKQQKKSA